MSTFTTSHGTRAQHAMPRYQSRPYVLHPARREHIYGRIKPMTPNARADLRLLIGGVAFALLFIIMFCVHS
jgi:hypothetical protein